MNTHASAVPTPKSQLLRLGVSFWIFGLVNNVLYVIILSAAQDLLPPSTPKGVVAFCNIAPALVAKVGWPYILKGRIRYTARILGCCALSVLGMIVVAGFDSLRMRLLGISLASFSSGLGELSFLQLSTQYTHPLSVSGRALGAFASGTGAAGICGAGFWWALRNIGVTRAVALSSILPFVIPAAYFLLVPAPTDFEAVDHSSDDVEPLLAAEYNTEPSDSELGHAAPVKSHFSLSLVDKWTLVQPMLVRYMLPLFLVYLIEYTINQGVAPTLVYPVPSNHLLFRHIIKSIRDYYPLWQLVYQTTVFLSRSSISLGIPALPAQLLPLPAIVQAIILALLVIESGQGIFPESSAAPIVFVFVLVGLEGICGGLAYVNVFYRISQEAPPDNSERSKQEREFKVGSVGFADSLGILLASLVAVPTEVRLCAAQVSRGKTICQKL